MGAHTTTDDPTRYRLASDVETWRLRDPIERVRSYLARTGQADSTFFAQVNEEADELGEHIREGCRALPDPAPLELFDHVYADRNAILDDERERYAAYLASFADTGLADTGAADTVLAETGAETAFEEAGR
jgi:pyruvate dehydrogenase E1 component alpha subunit